MKYQAMSETVLKAVGGKENITSVTHCATRLRIDARDTSIIDLQLAKSAHQAHCSTDDGVAVLVNHGALYCLVLLLCMDRCGNQCQASEA